MKVGGRTVSKNVMVGVAAIVLIMVLAIVATLTCGDGDENGEAPVVTLVTLKASADNHELRLAQLESDIAGLGSPPDVTALQDAIDALELLIDDVGDTVDDVQLILDAYELRIAALEVGGVPTAGVLTLTIVGSLPNVTNEATNYTFTVHVQNIGASPETGRIMLQLSAQSSSANVISFAAISGMLTPWMAPIYEPSQTACTKVTVFSDFFTLAAGAGATYQFTINVTDQDPNVFWWIPVVVAVD